MTCHVKHRLSVDNLRVLGFLVTWDLPNHSRAGKVGDRKIPPESELHGGSLVPQQQTGQFMYHRPANWSTIHLQEFVAHLGTRDRGNALIGEPY